MSFTASRRVTWRVNSALLGMIAGGAIMSTSLGVRQTFGLFIGPFSYDHGFPVTLIAFAIALHNLVWGFAQPFAGAAADRYGATPVIALGSISLAARSPTIQILRRRREAEGPALSPVGSTR